MKRIFIFDLDGTLIDSKNGILISLKYVLSKNAPEYLPYLNKSIIGPPIKGILEGFVKDDLLVSKLSKEFRRHYDSIGFLNTKLFDGVQEGLSQIENSRLFISTNKPKIVTDKILKKLKVDAYFNEVICIDSNSFSNKIQIVRSIVNNLDTNNITVIGDSKDDYLSAIDNNCNFVFCEYGYGDIKLSNSHIKIVNTPKELNSVF